MTRGRKPKNPADFGKQFEKLKITKPTPHDDIAREEHDMFLDTTFRQETDREKELELEAAGKDSGLDAVIALIKKTLADTAPCVTCDVETDGYDTWRTYRAGNTLVEVHVTRGGLRTYHIKFSECDEQKYKELVDALRVWADVCSYNQVKFGY